MDINEEREMLRKQMEVVKEFIDDREDIGASPTTPNAWMQLHIQLNEIAREYGQETF